jgi:hypothetical protein
MTKILCIGLPIAKGLFRGYGYGGVWILGNRHGVPLIDLTENGYKIRIALLPPSAYNQVAFKEPIK